MSFLYTEVSCFYVFLFSLGKALGALYFLEVGKLHANRCIHIKAVPSQLSVAYGVLTNIFKQLLADCDFNNEEEQRATLVEICSDVYPTASLQTLQIYAQCLSIVLNLKWSTPVAMTIDPVSAMRKVYSERLFQSVLNAMFLEGPTVLVIENAQNCDEISWKELHLLLDLPISLALLLTVRTEASASEDDPKYAAASGTAAAHRNDGGDSGRSSVDNSQSHMSAPSRFDMVTARGLSLGRINTKPTEDSGHYVQRHRFFFDPLKIFGDFSHRTAKVAVAAEESSVSVSVSLDPDSAARKAHRMRRNSTVHDLISDTYRAILEHPGTLVLEMTLMTRASVQELLRENIVGAVVPEDVVDATFSISRGNLFLCRNIIRFLQHRGFDEFVAAAKGLENRSRAILSVCGFDQLKADEQVVLKFSSIVGEDFTKEMVENIIPKTLVPKLGDIFDRLITTGLMEALDPENTHFYFPTQQLHQVIHDLIPRR